MQELVTITAPKHVAQYVSDNLSQTEVKSRLKALADTIDSRGWAVKNASVNLFNQPAYGTTGAQSDRLIDLSSFAHEVPAVDVHASDDILDEQNNPTAQHLSQMISNSSQAHRQATLQNLKEVGTNKTRHQGGGKSASKNEPPPDFWFMHQPDPVKTPAGYATFGGTHTVIPGTNYDRSAQISPLTPAEESLLSQLHKQDGGQSAAYGHTKVIQPMGAKHKNKRSRGGKNAPQRTSPTSRQSANRERSTSPKPLNPAILELANNDDLTVATIARQAGKKPGPQPPDNEVVVPLR
jgi:hypothetical protein